MRLLGYSTYETDSAPESLVTRVSDPLTHADKLTLVSLEFMKMHLRELSDDQNAVIASLIETAYDFLVGRRGDGWLNGCCLLTETFEWVAPLTRKASIAFPLRPLNPGSLQSFQIQSEDGSYLSVPSDDYRFFAGWPDAHLVCAPYSTWGSGTFGYRPQMKIRFTAGFGQAADVPADLKLAIRMLVASWFRQREATGELLPEVAFGLRSLAGRYRVAADHS